MGACSTFVRIRANKRLFELLIAAGWRVDNEVFVTSVIDRLIVLCPIALTVHRARAAHQRDRDLLRCL